MNFDNNVKVILREGKNYMTPLCIIQGSQITEFDLQSLYLIPSGQQTIEETPVMVKKPSLVFLEKYYSVTLYKQLNGNYIIKFKITEVTES